MQQILYSDNNNVYFCQYSFNNFIRLISSGYLRLFKGVETIYQTSVISHTNKCLWLEHSRMFVVNVPASHLIILQRFQRQ